MTYTHLTPNELVMIEAYFHQETPVAIVAKQLKRGRQTIYNVYNFLKCGGTALEYFEQYKENKRRCGRTKSFFLLRKKNTLQKDQLKVGPQTSLLAVQSEPSCSISTLYRRFKTGEFNVLHLPMQGKRKPNGYKENVENRLLNGISLKEKLITRHLKKSSAISKAIPLSAFIIRVLS